MYAASELNDVRMEKTDVTDFLSASFASWLARWSVITLDAGDHTFPGVLMGLYKNLETVPHFGRR